MKKTFCLVMLFALLLPLALYGQGSNVEKRFKKLKKLTNQFLRESKFELAADSLDKMLEIIPINIRLLYPAAQVNSILRRKTKAVNYLGKCIGLGWKDLDQIKKDPTFNNIRNELRYQQIIKLMAKDSYPHLTYPAKRTKLLYAIVVAKTTKEDIDWAKVVDAFTKKYGARVFVYDGVDPAAVMKELINYAPKYVAFIAKPLEVSFPFITRAKQMMCRIDEDPYEDALWGIITGYNYKNCLRMANAEKLTIKKCLSGFGSGWLNHFNEGLSFSECKKNVMFIKKPGKPMQQQKGPDDTTKNFVDALNTNEYQMMSTSGHATEQDWKIGYTYQNGCLFSKNGKLFGRDTANNEYAINTTNSKIYYSPGNCLIAHISDMDCMALAWLHNGANQFYGHTLWQFTDGSCSSFYIVEYFIVLQGRFTFSESIYFHRAAMILKGDSDKCCRSSILYGDPAWEARISPEVDSPYDQSLKFDKDGLNVAITFTVDFNKDCSDKIIAAFLPEFIREYSVKSIEPKKNILVLDNLIMIKSGNRKKGDQIKVLIDAKLLELNNKNE